LPPVADAFLNAHLNLQWLRPESAVCDAVASELIAKCQFDRPCLDLGCGNGLFSFVTAGGTFIEYYDWYRNAEPRQPDMYDAVRMLPRPAWVARRPTYGMTVGFDVKESLLMQAAALNFYDEVRLGDANRPLPFADETFATVFSNILSWVTNAPGTLTEIFRALRRGGRAALCLPTERFAEYCISYRWREQESTLLKLLNGGRADTMQWCLPWAELGQLVRRVGFRVIDRLEYWSPLTARVWDISLRPLSPVLVSLVGRLGETERAAAKRDWIEIVRPLGVELLALERASTAPGAYQLLYLERP